MFDAQFIGIIVDIRLANVFENCFTLFRPIEFSIKLHTIKLGLSIVYIEMYSQAKGTKSTSFLA